VPWPSRPTICATAFPRTSISSVLKRTSFPSSQGNCRQRSAEKGYAGDHIKWVGPLRLCLQPPAKGQALTLWQGARLRVQTGPIADLIASKLIRYDEIDQSDIRYLLSQGAVAFAEVEAAATRLPTPFAIDPLVRENLRNLKTDLDMWRGGVT